ncbi:MAG TPA: TaqI-like C-terminal specificity domain-containing protein [Terriglobales bacterium]|nr:TaqI-like C-terminal specificity domain-containing protein [Terriglobales bacterium]
MLNSTAVKEALRTFPEAALADAGRRFWRALGFGSNKTLEAGESPADFLAIFDPKGELDRRRAEVDGWRRWAFLFQITNDEIPSLAGGLLAGQGGGERQPGQVDSLVFLAIELGPAPTGEGWARGRLAAITREVNRRFPMPAVVLFLCGRELSLAVISRRENLRDPGRDVVGGRVSIVRGIECDDPHRGQLQILEDLAGTTGRARSFQELYAAWLGVLSTQTLNQSFYQRLANWFYWANGEVEFPRGQPRDSEGRYAEAMIRLLTRMIFVWFVKEKGLVPDELFQPTALRELLKRDPAGHLDESTYYKAILQNLFFATLNTEGADRGWRPPKTASGRRHHYLEPNRWRQKDCFAKPAEAERLFREIPFLNGGLFDCLDREVSEHDLEREPKLRKLASVEGHFQVLRVDGFSERDDIGLVVPNRIFLGEPQRVDLNAVFGTTGKPYEVEGLLSLLRSYKFTIEENTPLDEEVALDPELLGRVFENLLASYNEDTRTTARKKSGSFYTPRLVVDFMVGETLTEYFVGRLGLGDTRETRGRLRRLLAHDGPASHDFSPEEAETLVGAVEGLRALDPACGSGAFPMGLLERLLVALRRLDPENRLWKARNRARLEKALADAREISMLGVRDERVREETAALEKFDEDFSASHHLDYARKLYLIERCLYGVDIQPIAVQIAKLRLFIALVVAQRVDRSEPNCGVTPLPNLETKLVAADSLVTIARQGALRTDEVVGAERALRQVSSHYYSARTLKAKREIRRQIEELRDDLRRRLQSDGFVSRPDAALLAGWDPFDQNAAAGFFDPEWMFQIRDGFDLVIGNPPYVRQEKLGELKDKLKGYACYAGTADLYVYFYERGVELLREGGAFAFISSNKWMRSAYGKKLRDWLPKETRLRWVIDFGDQPVFEAIAYPVIVVAVRRRRPGPFAPASDDGEMRVFNWPAETEFSRETFPGLPERSSFPVPQGELGGAGWQLEIPVKRDLLQRLRAAGTPLGKFCDGHLYYGIKTGLNAAFVISGERRRELIEADPHSEELLKPFLRGRDVKRWHAQPQDLWLIFAHRGIEISRYPAVRKHLARFRKQLEPRPLGWEGGPWEGRKPGNYAWYELQDAVEYWPEFEKPKIVYPDISDGPCFAWDASGAYPANTVYMAQTRERWICALLNTSVLDWFYSQIASSIRGGYRRAFSPYISQLPIPHATAAQQEATAGILDLLASGREPDPRLEQLSNALAYELFFPEDLHFRGIRIFGALAEAGLEQWAAVPARRRAGAAADLARRCSDTADPLFRMLLDLQSIEVVRIVEGAVRG